MSDLSLAGAFAAARAEDRAALVPYVTAGHPTPAATAQILTGIADDGADVIELGIPFSDPLADGPTIQRSSFEAIAQGVDLRWTLDALAAFRARRDTPVVLFTYLNPVLRHGLDRFLADAADAGAQGVLLTDLPVGADPGLEGRINASPLDLIRLVAPTTKPQRVREIAAAARGFLYYVSRTGVTGARQELASGLAAEVEEVRRMTEVPVAVGFGISTPEQAATVARVADGVVVGSALVDALQTDGVEGGRRFVRALRKAVEGARRA
ncbi:tryptophan synthase subunit alpha [Longimicrobium sp.]|uniref:tryptophan synthase subunit alpha n=1 Tax=Longimicrobium sp. TaxID=2029185 RepID=UPI003B3B45A9